MDVQWRHPGHAGLVGVGMERDVQYEWQKEVREILINK